MSSLWDVPQYLIMAFSLAFDAPAEKASRVSFSPQSSQTAILAKAKFAHSDSVPDEDLWLRAVKIAAPRSDILQAYGSRVFVTSTGRYYVATPIEREEILALRNNPEISARVLAAATEVFQEDMQARTREVPTPGALLVAHMAGEDTAVRYVRALAHDPEQRAMGVLPGLAAALGEDRSLTMGQLDSRLARAIHSQGSEVAAAGARLKGTVTKTEIAKADSTTAKLASR